MTQVLKMFRFLLAAATLAVFASPAVAAPPVDKKFFASITDPTASGAFVEFTITNATPDANSVLNSFIIVPPPNVTIVRNTWTVTEPVGAGATFTTVPTTGQITQLKVNGIGGLQPTMKSGVHTMKVQFQITYAASSCGAAWNAQAFAGNAWSQAFALQTTAPETDLAMAFPDVSCSLAFTVQPTDTLSGAIIDGPVTVQASPASAFGGQSITLGFSSTPGGSQTFATGSNIATVDGSGVAKFPSLTVTGLAGAYTLSATAAAVVGSPTATSSSFNILANDGILYCDGLPLPAGTVSQYQEGNTHLIRYGNKDGSVCVQIPFQLVVTNAGKTVEVTWDDILQPYTSLQSETTWPLELVDPVAALPKPTKYNVGAGYFVAPTCVSSLEPASLGTLAAAITDPSAPGTYETSIKINFTVTPTVYPFPIVVGSNQANTDPERMLVTGAAGGGFYTVVRGSGNTTKSTHSSGASVMSTPLPISDSSGLNGLSGNQVPVCIIKETFTTQAFGTAGCPAQSGPEPLLACIQTVTKLWLIGDVFIARD